METEGSKRISVRESIRFGWETFKARPWFFASLPIVLFLVQGLPGSLSGSLEEKSGGVALLVLVVGWALSLIVFGGILLLIIPGIIWSIKYQF